MVSNRDSHGDRAPDDVVLAGLQQVEHDYRDMQRKSQDHSSALTQAQGDLAHAQDENTRLSKRLLTAQRHLREERKQAKQQRERAQHLTEALKHIHRALFRGDVHDLILRACLELSGATRGLYVTVDTSGDRLQVRSVVDVDGYPGEEPSAFIQALCRRALDNEDTFIANKASDFEGLPKPESAAERFRQCVVAPVVLRKDLNGVVLVADRQHGQFREQDVDALVSVGDQASVAVENLRLQHELQRAYLITVTTLADAMEVKDAYTHGHCEQVARYSRLIAQRLQLSHDQQSVVWYAALLHDVGKIGVSDSILNKPGALLPDESELVRAHVRIGHTLLHPIPMLTLVADAVLHHHEWYDGSGYPNGLRGVEIPIASRIVGTVDAYCAMITKRSYKEAFSHEAACEELRHCVGTQFDPTVVEAFLEILATYPDHTLHHDEMHQFPHLPGLGR